ncbi:MAG: threonine synthase [Lawsonibacter sp.]|jgi:threonine synthase
MKEYRLVCSVCGKPFTGHAEPYVCDACGGLLEPEFDLAGQAEHYREVIRNGCKAGVWDYRELLPIDAQEEAVTLGEGNTPLLQAQRLAKVVGVEQLYLKNETLNPSGTYKDRFATLALSIEKAKKTPAVALGSAGNAAAAMAAYSAKAAMPCFVLLPPGAVAERGWQVRGYGANLIRMEHTIDDCINMAKQGEELFGWKSLTTNMLTNPLPSDAYKTVGYEIGKQMDYKMPDWIIVPVGGAALFNKIYKGCKDMLELGLIDKMPHFVGAQAAGCAPMVDAYQKGLKKPGIWPGVPETIAFAIADVCVYDGVTAMDILEKTGGCAESATDEETLEAMHLIASKEAVVAEPASACSVACARKLVAKGVIKPTDSVLCVLSGNGMRDLKLMEQGQKEVPFVKHHDVEAVKEAVHNYLKEQK